MLEGTYFRMVRSIVARATRAKVQRARLQARLGSKASREEQRAELTVPQLTIGALWKVRPGQERREGGDGLAVYCATLWLAPVHWRGNRARETKLTRGVALLRSKYSSELKAAVRPARPCARQQREKEGAGSAAVRRAEQRRATRGENEFFEGRGAKDVGPAGDAESAAREEASLGWSCSAAEGRRSVQGHYR